MNFSQVNVRAPMVAFLIAAMLVILTVTPAFADGHEADASPTVLITGANRGLGLEFARQYQEAGWTVIGTARSPDRADDLKALGVEVVQLDVVDRDSIAALAAELDGRGIDMLINNAGIFPRVSEIEAVSADDYARTLMVNTLGPMLVTQALMPNLRGGELKRIVNITSQLASIENNSGGYYGYRESKAALNMFTRSLALELGPEGFICLAIHPGWVRTDMGGPQANLSAEESITAMRKTIDNMTPEYNGVYRGYTGEIVAW
jgi:NAD(P)-dependent dehydrogenase (short-subunit alcohol dehydrogenase family)